MRDLLEAMVFVVSIGIILKIKLSKEQKRIREEFKNV